MQPRGSDSWGATVVNVLGVAVAVVADLFLSGWAVTLQSGWWGEGPITGSWRIHVVPLLMDCAAAALAGLALGALLRTRRPALYAGLLAAVLIVRSSVGWRIGQPAWWDWLWIGGMMLLPGLAAGAVALWTARRRGGPAPALQPAS